MRNKELFSPWHGTGERGGLHEKQVARNQLKVLQVLTCYVEGTLSVWNGWGEGGEAQTQEEFPHSESFKHIR